jgi:branched-chain amino acid transport system ATP-binding protein
MRLEVAGLRVRHGAFEAVVGIDLAVDSGEVVALLGTNGAGKTTTLRAVSGLVPVASGQVRLDGLRLNRLPPHQVVAAGVAHVPEGRRVFARMTVRENLEVGAYVDRRGAPAARQRVEARFPILGERRDQLAGTLSGGEQQQLALGRALMSSPRVLLLDEPSTGLAPQAVEAVLEVVADLARDGVAVLLVEQDVGLALDVAARAYAWRPAASSPRARPTSCAATPAWHRRTSAGDALPCPRSPVRRAAGATRGVSGARRPAR